jgi:hypothetical protein
MRRRGAIEDASSSSDEDEDAFARLWQKTGNLARSLTEEDVSNFFGSLGELCSVKIMWPRTPEEQTLFSVHGMAHDQQDPANLDLPFEQLETEINHIPDRQAIGMSIMSWIVIFDYVFCDVMIKSIRTSYRRKGHVGLWIRLPGVYQQGHQRYGFASKTDFVMMMRDDNSTQDDLAAALAKDVPICVFSMKTWRLLWIQKKLETGCSRGTLTLLCSHTLGNPPGRHSILVSLEEALTVRMLNSSSFPIVLGL